MAIYCNSLFKENLLNIRGKVEQKVEVISSSCRGVREEELAKILAALRCLNLSMESLISILVDCKNSMLRSVRSKKHFTTFTKDNSQSVCTNNVGRAPHHQCSDCQCDVTGGGCADHSEPAQRFLVPVHLRHHEAVQLLLHLVQTPV